MPNYVKLIELGRQLEPGTRAALKEFAESGDHGYHCMSHSEGDNCCLDVLADPDWFIREAAEKPSAGGADWRDLADYVRSRSAGAS